MAKLNVSKKFTLSCVHDSAFVAVMSQKLHVTVWGENVHERENPLVAKIYPDGMHRTIADAISEDGNC